MCSDPAYQDYAEAIEVDYDPALLSYTDVLDAFFRAHDAIGGGRSRQYSSIIFAHDDGQRMAAEEALSSRPRATTTLEDGGAANSFWLAEAYHQKWLLQRKRELFLSLGMTDTAELVSPPATLLNAFAAGKVSAPDAMDRLDQMLAANCIAPAAHGEVRAVMAEWQTPVWRR